MSNLENTNLDGNMMTTSADDNGTLISEPSGDVTLDGPSGMTGDQAMSLVAAEEMVVTDVIERVEAVEAPEVAEAEIEEILVNVDPLDVDPLACSFSSSIFASADDAALGGSPPPPAPSAMMYPVLAPTMLAPETKEEEEDEGNVITRSRKIIGRKQAVVDDDGESQSSVSAADVDTSLASSSKGKRKGNKRGRRTEKDVDYIEESKTRSSSMEVKRKKGKKRETKVTPEYEEEVSDGKYGEPKGITEQDFADYSSSVLSASMLEWADKIDEIRAKSKNLQGKLSGDIKKYVTKIKNGTTVLGVRAAAVGDPGFLRLRNTELTAQLCEMQREIVRLEEQLRRSSPKASPPRKRRMAKTETTLDSSIPTDSAVGKMSGVMSSLIKETFPPLPQRTPRGVSAVQKSGGDRATSRIDSPYVAPRGPIKRETGMESFYTQRINALVIARDREIERQQKEQSRKDKTGLEEKKNGRGVDRIEDRGKGSKDGNIKVGPTIISDVQIVPPLLERPKEGVLSSAMSELETEWRTVMGGKRGGRGRPPKPMPFSLSTPPSFRNTGADPSTPLRDVAMATGDGRVRQRPQTRQPVKVKPLRPPQYSAVTITGKTEGFSYASALKNARDNIDLKTLGIQATRIRKAINGGVLIEVSGENFKTKAEELVVRLRTMFKDSAVVSCPIKKRELRIVGFDESVTTDEICEVVCSLGGCSNSDIKIGPIRIMANGLGTVWVQLPVAAAAKVADEGRIHIGWTVARVELLQVRPLQCYRCWSYGHVQSACNGVVNRKGACFKCGQQGHVASTCKNAPHCVVCFDSGLEASHRLGGPQCTAQVRQDALVSERRRLAVPQQGNV